MSFFKRLRGKNKSGATAATHTNAATQIPDHESMSIGHVTRVIEELRLDVTSLRTRVETLENSKDSAHKDDSQATIAEESMRPTVAPPDFTSASADELYAYHLGRYLESASQSPLNGSLESITIIGDLRDGTTAWFSQTSLWCGHTPRDMFEGIERDRGRTVRARIVTNLWGCHITAVVPSLERSASSVADIAAVVPVPESVANSWQASLVAGDVVTARVPYDDPRPLDRTGKMRPVVFIRWEYDYALCRPIYDAHGHVADHELGDELIDTGCLDKRSVVRRVETDLDPTQFDRKLGRVGPRDRQMMNLPATSRRSFVDEASRSAEFGRPTDVSSVNPLKTAMGQIELATLAQTRSTSPNTLLTSMLHLMSEDSHVRQALYTDGISFSVIGDVFSRVIRARDIFDVKGTFTTRLSSVMDEIGETPYGYFVSEVDIHKLPILKLTLQTPTGKRVTRPETSDTIGTTSNVRLDIPDDYATPDLIILDQFSVAQMLGEARLEMTGELKRLRGDGGAPAYIIGSDSEPGMRSFQRAAENRGWSIAAVDDRADQVDKAQSLAVAREIDVVTVVSIHADMVATLENLGFTVNVVSTVSYD